MEDWCYTIFYVQFQLISFLEYINIHKYQSFTFKKNVEMCSNRICDNISQF